jgi:sugar (pentulose or hexulose) kinase
MRIAVLDFGKTNSKLLVFNTHGEVLFDVRTRPNWHRLGGFRVLDDEALADWAVTGLHQAARQGAIEGVIVSAHGCTFALAGANGLVRPILDYEQEPPENIASFIDADLPTYEETLTPPRPQGFNFGRHMLWLEHVEPHSFRQTKAILGYPQYWSWRLGGRQVTEASYMGCHSYLWAPKKCDFSSLVDRFHWREKMPPLARAGAVIGTMEIAGRATAIHNGVHDSNASLCAYRSLGLKSFTLVSTGTWVIILNSECPLDALDAARDMYVNVDVDGRPVPTIGFMGGREFSEIAGDWKGPVERAAIQRVIDKQQFALPAFAAAGQFGGTKGRLAGPESDPSERAAIAMLYVALMIDFSLDNIQSRNDVVADGGLLAGGVLTELLGQLRGDQAVYEGGIGEGSAAGAAALAFEAHGARLELRRPVRTAPSAYDGLEAYRAEWRRRLETIKPRQTCRNA